MEIDNELPILEDLRSDSKVLYLIFGGIASGVGIPPFEFFRTTQTIDGSKIFIRDFSQSWYQCGLPGHGENIFELGDKIKKKIEGIEHEELLLIGNSMGGFAALFFAAYLGRARAIVFSPQTFISPMKRVIHHDRRWGPQIRRTYLKTWKEPHQYDLRKFLSRRTDSFTAAVHICPGDRLDSIHAKNISDVKCINIFEHQVGGHNIVRYLRDREELVDILTSKI